MSTRKNPRRKPIDHSKLPPEIWCAIMREATFEPMEPSPAEGLFWEGFLGKGVQYRGLRASLVTKRYLVRVSREWHYLATPFLYESVFIGRITSLPSLAEGLLRPVSKGSGRIVCTGDFVKRLDYRRRDQDPDPLPEPPEDELLCTILARTPNLEVMTLRTTYSIGIPFRTPPPIQAILSIIPPTIKYFYWNYLNSPMLLPDVFFADHPKHQEIIGSFLQCVQPSSPDKKVSFPSVHTFILLPNSPMEHIASAIDFPALRHLIYSTVPYWNDIIPFSDPSSSEPRGLRALLGAIGRHLRTITLCSEGFGGDFPIPDNFFGLIQDLCPQVQRLDITFTDINSRNHQDVIPALASPLPASVQTIGLRLHGRLSREEVSLLFIYMSLYWPDGRPRTAVQFMERKNILSLRQFRRFDFKAYAKRLASLGVVLLDDQGHPLTFS